MKRLERIVAAYWEVGTALRSPSAPPLACGDALKQLNTSDRLRPEEWKLAEQMHILRYDIIEGNNEWREKRKVQNSTLIQFTRN
jgi:hypothetical protein